MQRKRLQKLCDKNKIHSPGSEDKTASPDLLSESETISLQEISVQDNTSNNDSSYSNLS
jgi:hypothetical protein